MDKKKVKTPKEEIKSKKEKPSLKSPTEKSPKVSSISNRDAIKEKPKSKAPEKPQKSEKPPKKPSTKQKPKEEDTLKLKDLEKKLNRYRRRYKQDKSEKLTLSSRNEELSKQNSQMHLQIETLQNQLENMLKPDTSSSSLHSLQMENLQEKLFAKNDVISDLKLQVSKLSTTNETLQDELSKSKTKLKLIEDKVPIDKSN